MAGEFVHLVADFVGVPATQLGDRTLLSGLLIAAASAAGVAPIGIPAVRERPRGGLAAVLVHDDCHITAHTFPECELLLVDVLAPKRMDSRRALDVFVRRLTAREVRSEARERG